MIYLCSPYSHPDPAIRELRYQSACSAVAHLLQQGMFAFSPVVHSHPLVSFGLPTNWQFWKGLDSEFLLYCDELAVLLLEGWQESIGVRAEMELATELGKPVWSLHPESISAGNRDRALTLAQDAWEEQS